MSDSGVFPTLEEVRECGSGSPSAVKKHYPQFFEYIIENYKDKYGISWSEALCWYFNGLENAPRCEYCGNPVRLINFVQGYKRYCCKECMLRDPERYKRIRQTIKERYGVENIHSLPHIKEKIKQTCRERYGGDSPMCSKEIRNKSKNTCLKKYGVDSVGKVKEIHEKAKQTNLKRYGVECPTLLDRSYKKHLETLDKRHKKKYEGLIEMLPDRSMKFVCPHMGICDKCEEKYFITTNNIHRGRLWHGSETCTRLLPISDLSSTSEVKIRLWLDNHGISYKTNNRSLLRNLELDIYIPEYKLAIEVNGCYWHSSLRKPKEYHANKWQRCGENGVRMLSLWEDWINERWEEVEEILKYHLGIEADLNKVALDHNLVDIGLGEGEIIEHKSTHGGYECWDTGIYVKIT